MHGAVTGAHNTSDGAATRSAGRVAQLEEGREDSGGDGGKALCLREEEEGEEEDDHTSLVPLALEQSRTLNAMITRLVSQR
jgi:hypothetical protein